MRTLDPAKRMPSSARRGPLKILHQVSRKVRRRLTAPCDVAVSQIPIHDFGRFWVRTLRTDADGTAAVDP